MTIFQSHMACFFARKFTVICLALLSLIVAGTFTNEAANASTSAGIHKLFDGVASWYGGKFHGRRTASGGIYDMHKLTCAHKTLPFGTKLLVFNPHNGKKVEVVVTDRGPYVGKRVVDLSKAAADKLNISGIGTVICFARDAVKGKPGAQELAPITPAYALHGELEIAPENLPLTIAAK
ncbi:MAG: septal ring lytic transglycosylase RlpA family protein [Candidatus Obscuribacterales bacterium]